MEEIEASAERVLESVPEWVWDGESIPVPVEDIADTCFRLRVVEVEDLALAPGVPELDDGQSLSGLLLPSRGEIWVNAGECRQWPPRRRFTIGHELGHWVLHQRSQTSLFCRHGQVDEGQGRLPLDPIEEEANAFAAALLMPAELVRRHYADCGGDFDQMCRRFDSSRAAMGRRLHRAVPLS